LFISGNRITIIVENGKEWYCLQRLCD